MKTIALDIGGVCLKIEPQHFLQRLGLANFDEIPQGLQYAMLQSVERGKMSFPALAEQFRVQMRLQVSDEALEAAFRSVIGETISEMDAVVAGLVEAGYKIVFFSDTSSIHLDEVRLKFAAARLVPDGIYSFEVGAKKPEAPMFAAFEENYGAPDYYFDDRAELIAGATAHGWTAHRFFDANTIKDLLFR